MNYSRVGSSGGSSSAKGYKKVYRKWLRAILFGCESIFITVLWIKLPDHTCCSWVKQSINRSLPSIAQSLFFHRIHFLSQIRHVWRMRCSLLNNVARNHENGDYSRSPLTSNTDTSLPRTQTSLFRWKCARKGRRGGDKELCLPSVPFPWSLAVHHQSLAFRARLFQAKNEAPEEEAGHLAITGSLLCPLEKKARTFSFNSTRFKIRTDNGHLFLAQSADFRGKPTTI